MDNKAFTKLAREATVLFGSKDGIEELQKVIHNLCDRLDLLDRPKVIPLEWNGKHSSSGVDGYYSVFKDNSGKWRWHFFFLEETMDSMMPEDGYDTMQDAQNAANAHHEQQVLSLLEL